MKSERPMTYAARSADLRSTLVMIGLKSKGVSMPELRPQSASLVAVVRSCLSSILLEPIPFVDRQFRSFFIPSIVSA